MRAVAKFRESRNFAALILTSALLLPVEHSCADSIDVGQREAQIKILKPLVNALLNDPKQREYLDSVRYFETEYQQKHVQIYWSRYDDGVRKAVVEAIVANELERAIAIPQGLVDRLVEIYLTELSERQIEKLGTDDFEAARPTLLHGSEKIETYVEGEKRRWHLFARQHIELRLVEYFKQAGIPLPGEPAQRG